MTEMTEETCHWCGKKCMAEFAFFALCDDCEKKCDAFWEDFRKRKFDDLDDFTVTQLVDRHRNVLALSGVDAYLLAQLLVGTYYGDKVWSSRSTSGHIASLFGDDYMLCYCASSTYAELMYHPTEEMKEAVKAFEKADVLDQKWRDEHEKRKS